jgi:hypothetical protein
MGDGRGELDHVVAQFVRKTLALVQEGLIRDHVEGT